MGIEIDETLFCDNQMNKSLKNMASALMVLFDQAALFFEDKNTSFYGLSAFILVFCGYFVFQILTEKFAKFRLTN